MELGSPFITGDRDPTEGETVAALVVCTSRRRDGLRRVERLLRSPWKRFCWSITWLLIDHASVANALAEHVTESAQCPETWEEVGDKGGTKTGADWPYYIVNVIARNLNGISYDDIWDMPLGELICHKVIIGEDNGQLQIAERELAELRKPTAEG